MVEKVVACCTTALGHNHMGGNTSLLVSKDHHRHHIVWERRLGETMRRMAEAKVKEKEMVERKYS